MTTPSPSQTSSSGGGLGAIGALSRKRLESPATRESDPGNGTPKHTRQEVTRCGGLRPNRSDSRERPAPFNPEQSGRLPNNNTQDRRARAPGDAHAQSNRAASVASRQADGSCSPEAPGTKHPRAVAGIRGQPRSERQVMRNGLTLVVDTNDGAPTGRRAKANGSEGRGRGRNTLQEQPQPWLDARELDTAPLCWSTDTYQALIRALDQANATSPFHVRRILVPLEKRGAPKPFLRSLAGELRRHGS